MTTFDLEEREAVAEFGRAWWIFLVTGILWFLVSIIILRFDYASVSAISILFGIVAIFAGVNEFIMLAASAGWWKVLHGLLGVLFIGVGIVAFIHPGNTFAALAAVFSFFLIFKGIFDIVVSIATKDEIHVWWLQLDARDRRAPDRLLGGRVLGTQRDAPDHLGRIHRARPRHHRDHLRVQAPIGREGSGGLATTMNRIAARGPRPGPSVVSRTPMSRAPSPAGRRAVARWLRARRRSPRASRASPPGR